MTLQTKAAPRLVSISAVAVETPLCSSNSYYLIREVDLPIGLQRMGERPLEYPSGPLVTVKGQHGAGGFRTMLARAA